MMQMLDQHGHYPSVSSLYAPRIFYARKIFRKQTGNFTFVVVTDRDDLDGQIYRNFLNTRTVSEEMRKFLGQHKRVVFR